MERHNFLRTVLFPILYSFTLITYAAALSTNSPVGYWKITDSATGAPRSIVKIWQTPNQELMGKIIKVFAKEGNNALKLCSACKGDKYNQPIVGMTIVSGLKAKQQQWANGEILDPENGKVYSCAMRTLENGNKLNVRGYIGLPFLGRAETWERIDLMSG